MTRQTIIICPGDTIEVKASKNRHDNPGPVTHPDGRHVLPVPYFNQWGPDADYAPGDCGTACVCSAVHFLTDKSPTVNDVSQAGGIQKGARWASITQLAKLLHQIVKGRARVRREMRVDHVFPLETDDLLVRQVLFEEGRHAWRKPRERRPCGELDEERITSHGETPRLD